jgi:hypothetical protein
MTIATIGRLMKKADIATALLGAQFLAAAAAPDDALEKGPWGLGTTWAPSVIF